MSYLGDIDLGQTFDFFFTSRSFSTGAPTTLAGTPSLAAYEDNSTTEITAGLTLDVDFDSVTGLNHVRVVATTANGYEIGKSYAVVIAAGTVGGVSVAGEVLAHFSIQARYSDRPRKNVALSDIPFLMVDETDGTTEETGLTVAGTVSKDGGSFGAVSGSISEVGDGMYSFDAAAADMNADFLIFRFTATGAKAALLSIRTRP